MANLSLLNANYHKLHKAIISFDKGKQNRDHLLTTYNDAIQQIPDYYNSKSKNKPAAIRPTTIAAASHNLVQAAKRADPKLLKIKPHKYMNALHEAHKAGNWILFDYDNVKPVDSSPAAVRSYVSKYTKGLHTEMQRMQTKQRNSEKQIDNGPEL